MMDAIPPEAGLCHTCQHARLVISAKGARFVMCAAAAQDQSLAKYPALPRIECHGHERPDPTKSNR